MSQDKLKVLHGNQGMTLVEMIVVMAIMSVVVMAVMSIYVPAHQSTVAQTQVSDVQSNLRLANNRMTQDLLTAGFLVTNGPIVFPDYDPADPNNPGTENPVDFTIRTRVAGHAFARVDSAVGVTGGKIRINVTDADMVARFHTGSKVRLFEPVSATEVVAGTYSVVGAPASGAPADTIDIDPGASGLSAGDIFKEFVLVGVKDGAAETQTIRYYFQDGALIREVNGDKQLLARNMESVAFAYEYTPEGRVRRVDIVLTGVTKALKDDAISGVKSRQVATSVSLRNVN